MKTNFICKRGCKECYHGDAHTHTYMCGSEVGKCPRCQITPKKGRGNDKVPLHWK